LNSSSTNSAPHGLRKIFFDKKDTEGNAVQLDVCYELSNGNIQECLSHFTKEYGTFLLIPIGGLSAGGKVFQNLKKQQSDIVIGLVITPPASISEQGNIKYSMSDENPTRTLTTHELHINKKQLSVIAGAGVVLDQLKATVEEALGKSYSVLGTDLTSSSYASCGATFMTGGMGPTRINFAQSVQDIVFCDGNGELKINNKKELSRLSETYGWTGIVQSVTLPIVKMPPYEFGLAIPISNTSTEIAKLVQYFADKTVITPNGLREVNLLVSGLELITQNSLELISKHSPNKKILEQLIANCKKAKKNAVIFISGLATKNPLEDLTDPLNIFVDNQTSGLSLEEATPFTSMATMKVIREGAPELARRQFMDAKFSYKDHTDINVVINLEHCSKSVKAIIKCYEHYKEEIETLIKEENQLRGNVLVYGHLNPQGLDPHYRITICSANESVLLTAKEKAKAAYSNLVKNINQACMETGSKITGGEKGIISNSKIFSSLYHQKSVLPTAFQNQLKKQAMQISQSNIMFRWRVKDVAQIISAINP